MNFYSEIEKGPLHPTVVKHIYEAGIKLECKQTTALLAALMYHKFNQVDHDDCDKYMIAATCLYLAGKVEDDQTKIRDVVNVFDKILHPNSDPMTYERHSELKESIIKCELLVLRMLKFQVNTDISPHKYLFHYLKALSDWLGKKTMMEYPIAQTTWALLTDFYLDSVCLHYNPKHLAVAIIYIALEIYGCAVPCETQAVLPWYKVLCEDLSVEMIWDITVDLCNIYEKEDKE